MPEYPYAALLRPVTADDLPLLRRFLTEPGLIGLDWAGYRDAAAAARRFTTDGYLGAEDGRLMVDDQTVATAAASFLGCLFSRPPMRS
jgi:hypothetical protein